MANMISLSTLQTLLFTVGPFLIPRLISYYRSMRTQSLTSPLPIISTPTLARNALNILFVSIVISLLSTLPYFSPSNIFTLTSSRIQTPTDVLFTRLHALRPPTSIENQLRSTLVTLDARCLYLTYGPDALAQCPFCKSDDPFSYFYYSIPRITLHHMLNLLALGLATSSAIAGTFGNRWRTTAVTVGAGLALVDMYMIGSYDWTTNKTTLRAEDLTHFYWRMRTFRAIAIGISNAGFAGLIWASSTNRMFTVPLTPAERTEDALRLLENTKGKLGAIAVVRNAVVREEALRKQSEAYWKQEKMVMGEVMDEREVVEGVRNALESGRVSIQSVEDEASKYAESITEGMISR